MMEVIPGSSADMAPYALQEAAPACPKCQLTHTKVIGSAQFGRAAPFQYVVCLNPRCRWAWDTRPKIK